MDKIANIAKVQAIATVDREVMVESLTAIMSSPFV
jgi:hypothetical protein